MQFDSVKIFNMLGLVTEFQAWDPTKLNVLFIPTLPLKVEYTVMLRMLSSAVNGNSAKNIE